MRFRRRVLPPAVASMIPFTARRVLSREAVQFPQDMDLNPLLDQVRLLFPGIELQKTHEGRDLPGRPVPVFRGEGEKGEDLDPQLDGSFQGLPDGLHPLPMPGMAGKSPLPGPAAVTIHDDGNVFGDAPPARTC